MGGTRQIWQVKLNADERRDVKHKIDEGLPEFDAVRQVLVERHRSIDTGPPAMPLAIPVSDIPKMSDAERQALVEMIQSSPDGVVGFPNAHSLNDCAMAIIGQLDETWRTWIQEVAEITLKIPLWQVIAGVVQMACDRSEIPAALIDPRWRELGLEKMPAHVTCEICGSRFTPDKVNQRVCSNRCGSELERRVSVS